MLAAGFSPGIAAGDEVAAYLERHGLKELLAVHLEEQLEDRKEPDRGELILRLAALYADLLESVQDPQLKVHLEQRSRHLLSQAPANSADELRLALLRGTYRTAEKIAEDHRLRLSSDEDVDAAKQTLTELIPRLDHLRQQIGDRAEVAERRLSRSSGEEALARGDEAERYRRLHSQATFLTAWALYYQSWLHARPDNAKVAQRYFAELLYAETPHPQPQDITLDLRSVEAIARSILGMALCKSLTASAPTAIEWVELLEPEGTYQPLRDQVPAWKIAVYLEHGEYRRASQVLRDYVESSGAPPVAWLRLVAVGGLEARRAPELVRYAVTELAARGELNQILDLAHRYGVDALGGSGFALQYVKGVLAYHRAQQEHGSDQPTVDMQLLALYAGAVDALRAAMKQPDAGDYPVAAAACERLIAWCLYLQGQFLAAREAFEAASDHLADDEAAEALWMAIVSLDKVVEASQHPGLSADLLELIDRFLERFPSSEHAPKLVLKRALAAKEPSPRAAEELLEIPPESEVYDSARRQAARVLYRLFRTTRGEKRVAHGHEYLAVAAALVAEDEHRIDVTDPTEVGPFVARCRRILEVALSDGIERLVAARAALDALQDLGSKEGLSLSHHQDELAYRRVQERLLSQDPRSAEALADQLWSSDHESIWSRLAARALFEYGMRQWKSSTGSAVLGDEAALELVVRHGGRVLREYEDDPDALDRLRVLTYHAMVAEAAQAIWERTRDERRGSAALFLYERLLDKRPRDARFLRAAANLAEALGDPAQALDRWRSLVAGSEVGSERWFEAKAHVIALLVRSDPQRALAVIEQHKLLHPDYGPEPWGSRIRVLEARLARPESDEATPDAPPAAEEPNEPQPAPTEKST
ncbi:MAG: hypothetical protein ACYSTY_00610 [Planctomycetota bacterium]